MTILFDITVSYRIVIRSSALNKLSILLIFEIHNRIENKDYADDIFIIIIIIYLVSSFEKEIELFVCIVLSEIRTLK